MKLHTLEIENFRAIEKLSDDFLDFTDYLGRPQTVNLIVGPNGSGKTSILDAIHLVVKVFENPPAPELREGLQYTVQQLVRGRGNTTKINFEYSIDDEEAEAINQVYESLNVNLPQYFNFSHPQPPLNISTKVL